MCGACVRVRRCSSASLGSGTARKRASVAAPAAESRKPKMGWGLVEGDSLPPTTARREGNKTAEERNTTKKNRMGSRCESKYGNTVSQDRYVRQNLPTFQAFSPNAPMSPFSSFSPESPSGAIMKTMKRATITLPDDLAEATEN